MSILEIDEDEEIPNIDQINNYLVRFEMTDTRLVQLMDDLGINQAELARRMGVPPTEVGKLYHGQRRMTVEKMRTVAKGLGVSVSDLLRPEDFTNRLSNDEHALLSDHRALSPVDQLRHRQIAAILANSHNPADTDT